MSHHLLFVLIIMLSLFVSSHRQVIDCQTAPATTSVNNSDCSWPQASDLPLRPTTTLTGLNCSSFFLTDLFPRAFTSLIILDSVISDTFVFHSNFSLQNASIKFINTRLRLNRQRIVVAGFYEDVYMSLLSGASLEFHNCTIVPPNQQQPSEYSCSNSSAGCRTSYLDAKNYAQGLHIMIARNSFDYDIIIKGCTYRFVSEDHSFLLNASTMPSGFAIEIESSFSLINYSFSNIQIVDNVFETNHGAMDLFALRFDYSRLTERQLSGNMINISGNTVVMRQIEGDDLMLLRETSDNYHVVLGPYTDATLLLHKMFLNDNNIDIRGVTLAGLGKLTIFSHGDDWLNANLGVKQLSACRNKVTMSPIFSMALHRDLNVSNRIDPAWDVYESRFLVISGFNHVDEIVINDNDLFVTTGRASAFSLAFGSIRRSVTDGQVQIDRSTSANIGSVTISNNKVECRDALDSSMIYLYCSGSCEHFGSFLISHNNFSAFVDQQNSNFTTYLDHEFRAVSYWGLIFAVSFYGSPMRDVGRISAVYNTIHLEGAPRVQSFSNSIDLQDCRFLEYSFNNVTLIQDDMKDRPFSIGKIGSTWFSYAHVVRITTNVLRISKIEMQQNIMILVSKAGANELVGIDITSSFDPRNRKPEEIDPSIVPTEFRDRPELIYKNVSIWNNTVKVLKIGSQDVEALASSIRVGALNSSSNMGYFYIFNNTLAALTYETSPAAGINGVTITTSGYTRNFSEVIISNNKIRISGVSGIASGVSFQTMDGFDASDAMYGKFYIGDGDTKSFKKLAVENNDIQVSNLKGAAAAVAWLGAGVFQIDNLELRKNIVLLTSRSLTEFFGSDPVFAPYHSFAGIDTSKLSSFQQDQHSYFYALCPYGNMFGFINIMTKNGFAASVGKMTIENEQIILEKSGSFFATKLGFYVTDSLTVRNINMKSLGTVGSSYRLASISSIFNIDSSSLGFQGLEYFSSVFPRITKINISNSIFSIQLPSSCGDIVKTNDKTILNNQLSFINILPAPSATVATTIVGDLITQNVSFTQDCSASSNMPSSTSSTNNIINVPRAAAPNTRTSVNVTELNIFSLPDSNVFMTNRFGKLITSTSTSSSTSATTSASIKCTTWNDNVMTARSLKSVATDFASGPSFFQGGCNDVKLSATKTRSKIASKSDVTPSVSGESATATRTASGAPWLPDVGNSAAAEKAVVVGQVATILSGNPALTLAVSRGAVLFRLASCYVNQKDLSPDKLAFRLDGHSTKVMNMDLYFPLSLIPGAKVGSNHVGASYRGGLVVYIVVFSLVIIAVLYFGSFNRDSWQKHQRKVVEANRNVSRKPKKCDPAYGLGPFWKHAPIDRGILLPFSFVASFWCEVAGGLATAAPNGPGDGVLALLPIILFCIFIIYVGKCLFEFTSRSLNCESKQPILNSKKSRRNKHSEGENNSELDDARRKNDDIVIPENFVVESDLYIARALLNEKPARIKIRQLLVSRVGRFLFIGDYCWGTNPTLMFHEDKTSPNLNELGDVAIEMHEASAKELDFSAIRTNSSTKFAPLSPSSSPSGRASNFKSTRYGQAEWMPMSGIATQFGGWLRTLQLPLKIKNNNNNESGQSSRTRRAEAEKHFPKFDFSLRSRLQLVWLAITLIITIIVCCSGGAATVDPLTCHTSFFVVLALCVVDCILLIWLRPFVVPFKTISNLIIDGGTVIGGLILLSCVTSSDLAESLADALSAGMMLCVLPGSIFGLIALILFILRIGCVVIFCKATVVPKTKLQELGIKMRDETTTNNKINEEEGRKISNRDTSLMRHFGDELLLQTPEFRRSPRSWAQFQNGDIDNQHNHHHRRYHHDDRVSSSFDSPRGHLRHSSGSMRPSRNDSHHGLRREPSSNAKNSRNPNPAPDNNSNNNHKSPFSSYREPQGFLKGLF